MANYFDKFDPPSPAQTPLPNGANPFDQFDPPSNGRTIARRGGKASGLFDDIPMAATGPARRGGLFDDIPAAKTSGNPYLDMVTAAHPPSSAGTPPQSSGNPYLDMIPDAMRKRPSAMSGPYDYLLPRGTTAPDQGTPDPYDYLRVKQPIGGASVRTMTPEEMKAMQPTQTVDRGTSIMDKIDAAVRGIADTATFGMADRIAAGLGSLTGFGGTAGDYSGNLARERAIDQADETKNPGSRIAGQLVGGLTFPVGAAAEGATLAGRAALGAGAGAMQGGLYGAGSSEDLTNLPDVAKNAATGAAGRNHWRRGSGCPFRHWPCGQRGR